MRRSVLLVVLASSCIVDRGRYEERQREICDPDIGCQERPRWPDQDRDGWGDGSVEPVLGLVPSAGLVHNRADCNDQDPLNTADLGLCPDQFGASQEIRLGIDGELEWVGVLLDEPLYIHEALDRCEGWGGVLGGPPESLGGIVPLWVTDAPPVPQSWGERPVEGELDFGPVVWTGSVLRSAAFDERAHVACVRAPADPEDFVSFAQEAP